MCRVSYVDQIVSLKDVISKNWTVLNVFNKTVDMLGDLSVARVASRFVF